MEQVEKLHKIGILRFQQQRPKRSTNLKQKMGFVFVKYLFENKRAQLELFGETATAEPDDSLTPDDDLEGDDTFFDDEEAEQPELIEEDVHD